MEAVLLAVIQTDRSDCLQDSFQDGLLASKHDFFLSGMISCLLSFTCTVQFLLSTAKGRCLTLKIHFSASRDLSLQGGQEPRLVDRFGEHFASRAGQFLPAEPRWISGSFFSLFARAIPRERRPATRQAVVIRCHPACDRVALQAFSMRRQA
jgi:hypothetical protein